MIEKGFANSRMKDFYDVWTMLGRFEVDGSLLRKALAVTFERRGTKVETIPPVCFGEEFAHDPSKAMQWKAYLRKNAITDECPIDFAEVIAFIAPRIVPLLPCL